MVVDRDIRSRVRVTVVEVVAQVGPIVGEQVGVTALQAVVDDADLHAGSRDKAVGTHDVPSRNQVGVGTGQRAGILAGIFEMPLIGEVRIVGREVGRDFVPNERVEKLDSGS